MAYSIALQYFIQIYILHATTHYPQTCIFAKYISKFKRYFIFRLNLPFSITNFSPFFQPQPKNKTS